MSFAAERRSGLSRFQSTAPTQDYDDDDSSEGGYASEEGRLSRQYGEAQEDNNAATVSSTASGEKRNSTVADIEAIYNDPKKAKNSSRVKRKVLTETDLTQSKGLSVLFTSLPHQFHRYHHHTKNSNSNRNSKYQRNRKDMARFSRQLIHSYQQWAHEIVPGTPLQEVLWKLHTLNSKTSVKRYLQTMRHQVRDRHVERIYGLEKAEELLSQLEEEAEEQPQLQAQFVDEGENINTVPRDSLNSPQGGVTVGLQAANGIADANTQHFDPIPDDGDSYPDMRDMVAIPSSSKNESARKDEPNEDGDDDGPDMNDMVPIETNQNHDEYDDFPDYDMHDMMEVVPTPTGGGLAADMRSATKAAAATTTTTTPTAVPAVTPHGSKRKVPSRSFQDQEKDDEFDSGEKEEIEFQSTFQSRGATTAAITNTQNASNDTVSTVSKRRVILEDSEDEEAELDIIATKSNQESSIQKDTVMEDGEKVNDLEVNKAPSSNTMVEGPSIAAPDTGDKAGNCRNPSDVGDSQTDEDNDEKEEGDEDATETFLLETQPLVTKTDLTTCQGKSEESSQTAMQAESETTLQLDTQQFVQHKEDEGAANILLNITKGKCDG